MITTDKTSEPAATVHAAASAAPAGSALALDSDLTADGHAIARGVLTNTLGFFAANARGIFTLLVARVLGDAALGQYGLGFALTDQISKLGTFGLDTAVVPIVARRASAGDAAGSRRLLRRAVGVGVGLSALVALAAVVVATAAARRWTWIESFGAPTRLMMFALPGLALGRISVGVARGLRDMRNDLYSRGLVETWVMIAGFLIAMALGLRELAPATAPIAGVAIGGIVSWRMVAVRLEPKTVRLNDYRLKGGRLRARLKVADRAACVR